MKGNWAKGHGPRFVGVLKRFDFTKGYGFITCDEVSAQGYQDCFVHGAQLSGAKIGDEVEFGVSWNAQGKPQADSVMVRVPGQIADPQGITPSADPAIEIQRGPGMRGEVIGNYQGKVKSFNSEKGYGFIDCPKLKSEGYQNDVFLHRTAAVNFSVGDMVAFEVYLNRNGQPQSRDLELLCHATEEDKASQKNLEGDDIGGFHGEFMSFKIEAGFGFIDCQALKKLGYPGDLFVHSSQLNGATVGDLLEFMAYVTAKGQLRAKNCNVVAKGSLAKGGMRVFDHRGNSSGDGPISQTILNNRPSGDTVPHGLAAMIHPHVQGFFSADDPAEGAAKRARMREDYVQCF